MSKAGGSCAVGSGIPAVPICRVPSGARETAVPSTVTGAAPGIRVVPAMARADGARTVAIWAPMVRTGSVLPRAGGVCGRGRGVVVGLVAGRLAGKALKAFRMMLARFGMDDGAATFARL